MAKNSAESETLQYLQISLPRFPGYWQKTQDSWVTSIAVARVSALLTISQAPVPTGCLREGQVTTAHGFMLKMNPNLRESKSFIMGSKHALPLPQKGDLIYIILESNQNWPSLQKEILSFSSKAVCCITFLKKIVCNKGIQCFCLQVMKKCERPMENCFPTGVRFLPPLPHIHDQLSQQDLIHSFFYPQISLI